MLNGSASYWGAVRRFSQIECPSVPYVSESTNSRLNALSAPMKPTTSAAGMT